MVSKTFLQQKEDNEKIFKKYGPINISNVFPTRMYLIFLCFTKSLCFLFRRNLQKDFCFGHISLSGRRLKNTSFWLEIFLRYSERFVGSV